jgi:hypothetical protein
VTLATALLATPGAGAQSQPAPAASSTTPSSAELQIAAAVLAAPADMRAGATVLGYAPDGHFTPLRQGRGALTCLGSDPKAERFHVGRQRHTSCFSRACSWGPALGGALKNGLHAHLMRTIFALDGTPLLLRINSM